MVLAHRLASKKGKSYSIALCENPPETPIACLQAFDCCFAITVVSRIQD